MKSLAHEIRGLKVHASDGEIGTVKDVVFDAHGWRVHFLEVDTGWIFGRDVLVPIEKLTEADVHGGSVRFDLTKDAIENSPSAASARPAEEHYDLLFPYFGLSSPWGADVVAPPPQPPAPSPLPLRRLIFARDLDGFELDAQGREVGTLRDVLVDLERRRVTSLSADLGGLMEEQVAEIRRSRVVDIDMDARTVRLDMSQAEVEASDRLSPDDLPYILPYFPPML